MSNILVTGISKGLGLIIASNLLEAGHSVYGVSRSISPDVEKLCHNYSGHIFLKQFDLRNSELVKKELFDAFIDLDIPIHGFVNNAAIAYDDIITNLQLKYLEGMYRVNVFSPMIIVKNVIRNFLLHRTCGSIVHISSVSVHTGYKGLAMYASSKGALEAFSKNTAREWGERGIRSNCVVAGFMETDMSSGLSDEQKNRIYKRTSLKQPTNPKSVAAMVEFLLSDLSISITGQSIFVDSGTI